MSLKISVLKTVLAVLNTSLAFLGVGLVALSIFELNSSSPGTVEHLANVVQIFIGSFVILTSFLGCFGTCRAALGLLWTYSICLLILLAFQLYLIIVAHSTDYVRNASDEFERLWRNRSLNGPILADLERTLFCCGRIGARDYSSTGKPIPENCYRNAMKSSEHLFDEGCLAAMQKKAANNGEMGVTVKWILFCIEALSLTFAVLLGVSVRNKRRREQF